MTDRELMQQALEALELELPVGSYLELITALRERLAQPVQEPVAWVREHELPLAPGDAFSWVETFVHKTPLYTSPPASKPWVGLTDEEKSDLWCESTGRDCVNEDTHVFADSIEAKLREKNT